MIYKNEKKKILFRDAQGESKASYDQCREILNKIKSMEEDAKLEDKNKYQMKLNADANKKVKIGNIDLLARILVNELHISTSTMIRYISILSTVLYNLYCLKYTGKTDSVRMEYIKNRCR